jgi:hypothetical protein
MTNQTAQTGGSSFTTLLLVLFIGLKLTHYIDWSWWWVMSPLWIPISFVCAIWIILGILRYVNKHKKRY